MAIAETEADKTPTKLLKTQHEGMEESMPDEAEKDKDYFIWNVQSNREDNRQEIINFILSHG